MSRASIGLDPELATYLVAHGNPPDEILQDLIDATDRLGRVAGMQIAPEQGAFITWLTRMLGATRAIEIGVFTGYSALCIARGLPEDGHLLCCDVSEEWTDVAKRYWDRAGVADRITLEIAPAIQTLRNLPAEPAYDLAFVDADKGSYAVYFEELLRLVRPGGVILADNVLRSGRVLDPTDEASIAIDEFNRLVRDDERVDTVMVPIGDGTTLLRVR
ncbi:MAG: O-methyltransferase [Acidimicrobiia bacterium]